MTTGLAEHTRVATVIPIVLPGGAALPANTEGIIVSSWGKGVVYEVEFPGNPPPVVQLAAEVVCPIEENTIDE